MNKAQAVHIKARSVLRDRGHPDGEINREYKDWHIEIRSGGNFVSIWSSDGMVFLSLSTIPVYHRPGPWEQHLDRLYHRVSFNGRETGRD